MSRKITFGVLLVLFTLPLFSQSFEIRDAVSDLQKAWRALERSEVYTSFLRSYQVFDTNKTEVNYEKAQKRFDRLNESKVWEKFEEAMVTVDVLSQKGSLEESVADVKAIRDKSSAFMEKVKNLQNF